MSFFSLPKYAFLFGCVLVLSCNSSTSSKTSSQNRNANTDVPGANINDSNHTVRLHLALSSGSKYLYTISNESETELEANGKTVNNERKSDVSITSSIQKDSTGNFILHMHYDKIHLYAKTGDKEIEQDADNAATSMDPTERMLGILKEANISATVSPSGKVLNINGYKELGEKILAGVSTDEYSRNIAQSQWEKVVGDGMVKKSLEQMFNLLPGSAKQVGDTWQQNTKQKGEIDLNVTSTFKLQDIEDGIASIESEGEMTSDKGTANIMGYLVATDLHGNQEGEYKVETNTGMVLENTTTSKLKGTFQMMGKEIPVTMKTKFTMNGKKVQ